MDLGNLFVLVYRQKTDSASFPCASMLRQDRMHEQIPKDVQLVTNSDGKRTIVYPYT